MKVVATLRVKDEVELIEQCIGHLREIGVDHIIACDMNSTDGTYEALQSYRSDKDFWIVPLRDLVEDEARVLTALVKSARADWVICLDADEFWIPATGSLRDCAALPTADVIMVDRYNIPVGPAGPLMPAELRPPHYGDLLLLAEPVDDAQSYLRQNASVSWIWAKAEPKVMARPKRIKALEYAGHDVFPADSTRLRRSTADDLFIAHLPFTSRARFHRKVENIRRTISAHDAFFDGAMAWHWRRWLTLAEQGRLDEEYDSTVFTADAIAALRQQGSIRSAAEILRPTR